MKKSVQGANRGQGGEPEKGEAKGTMQGANRGEAKADGRGVSQKRGKQRETCRKPTEGKQRQRAGG